MKRIHNIHRAIKKIAVVIPCFNEAASIAQVIKRFPRGELTKGLFHLRVYVVDNNSTDDTANIARQAGATVIQELQKGKGHALRAGFRALASDTDYVVMIDGDDTYSPEEITRMVEPLRSDFCDVVVGSRLGGSIKASAMTTFNRLGNWVFTNAVRTVYRANVTDVLTGYFAWKKQALDGLYPHLQSEGFAIEMEMVTKMARLGDRITSVPISYHPRAGESHLRPVQDGARILKMFLRNLAWKPSPPLAQAVEARPRKIVFVSDGIYPYMKGGKEKRLHEISKHLARMGYDVHIYTMHWWAEAQNTRIEDGVQLHALCKHHSMYHGDRRAIAEGVIFGLACLKLLRVKFDVLDVDHMPFFPILSSWLICRLRGRRLYGTWHEALSHQEWTNYMGPSGVIASVIEHISIGLPHTITAASAHTKEQLAVVHGRAERVALVASGIDTALIQSVEPAATRFDVLYVGRLVKDKNVRTLVRAVHAIAQKDPSVRCGIIGQGIEKPYLERLARQLDVQDNITFMEPFAEAKDVYAFMKAAKVFCLPSTREGFSLVTLEALGCGTPVITVDAPANAARYLVQDGVTGSIVPCTAEALAGAIAHWTALPKKPDTAAEVADYDWRNLAEKQVKVYTA